MVRFFSWELLAGFSSNLQSRKNLLAAEKETEQTEKKAGTERKEAQCVTRSFYPVLPGSDWPVAPRPALLRVLFHHWSLP
jgi:hypothetical protein